MSNHKFLKKVKNFVSRFKFLTLSIIVMAIAIPFIVRAYNTPITGYLVLKNSSNSLVFHYGSDHAVYPVGVCVSNTASNDYFIPTASYKEWKAFFNQFYSVAGNSSYLSFTACDGDGVCDAASGENCSTAPRDCGTCAVEYCGNGYCSSAEGAEVCQNSYGNYPCCSDCQQCNNNGVCENQEALPYCSDCNWVWTDPCRDGNCSQECYFNCPGYY